jgi:hypothetical protein
MIRRVRRATVEIQLNRIENLKLKLNNSNTYLKKGTRECLTHDSSSFELPAPGSGKLE